jgi:hypothetical protein
MLSDNRINELKKIKDQGEEATKLLEKYWKLKNDISCLERMKETCNLCYKVNFNNGYCDAKFSINNPDKAAKYIKQMLQIEIDSKTKELEELNDLDDFIL